VSKDDLFELRCRLREGITNQVEKLRIVLVKPGRAELTDFPQLPGTTGFDRLGIELVIPIMLEDNILGLLFIGKKKSGRRYSDEDIELLTSITNQGLLALERLKTQETIILERAEKEKLKELSNLKSEFISHVSHELRTPLTSIQWSIANLLDGIPEPPAPKIRQYLEGVHDSSQHLGRMIEDLLDVSRIEAGRIEIVLERLDIKDEVKKVLDILKPLAEKKNIRFKTTQPESLWVKADQDRLRDILTNILDNAIKYSNDGDEVEIKIEKENDTKKVTGAQNEMVSISIIDHGPGIPKEKQQVIFERFERIREDKATRQKGLGLGLHIVKKLVELQGGQIWVESVVRKGSAFILVLPGG
jgi:signal transduction histidine kinase